MKPDLVSLDDAVASVMREARHIDPEPAELGEAFGRVVATPLLAPFDVPVAAASLMDGYALASRASSAGSVLHVAFEVPAGRVGPRALLAGECARILTGAPIPEGADAVVKQEDVTRDRDAVTLRAPVLPGEHIRAAGSDFRKGEVLIEAGTEIDAGGLGLIASVGLAEVTVVRRPVVAILATGDELRDPGEPLLPGTIYESNTRGLAVQARLAGGLPLVLGRAPDDPQAIVSMLTSARADIYVTSGGASVGDYDFAGEVLERLGGRRVFWQVAIRPGKPVLFGIVPGRTPTLFFALPGNPGASALTFDALVRPAIRSMTRAEPLRRSRVLARLESPLTKPVGLTFLARGRLVASDGRLMFRPFAQQGSMSIGSLSGLGAVAVIPPEVSRADAGAMVEVEPWGPVTAA